MERRLAEVSHTELQFSGKWSKGTGTYPGGTEPKNYGQGVFLKSSVILHGLVGMGHEHGHGHSVTASSVCGAIISILKSSLSLSLSLSFYIQSILIDS